MNEPTTRQEWVDKADREASNKHRTTFPPENPISMGKLFDAATTSFQYLQTLRREKKYAGNTVLACAEHYAFARAVVSSGGLFMYPLMMFASVAYSDLKRKAQSFGLLQLFGWLTSAANAKTTPASPEQVIAANEGAVEGLFLHYKCVGGVFSKVGKMLKR